MRQQVGAWHREPGLDYDDGTVEEYAYEHDSDWMTLRVEGNDEHGWKVQGTTDYRNEIDIMVGRPRFDTMEEALQFAYAWMESNRDISRWTRMDRASEYATSDKYDYTKGSDFDFS